MARGQKVISEIFLTRLLATKVTFALPVVCTAFVLHIIIFIIT